MRRTPTIVSLLILLTTAHTAWSQVGFTPRVSRYYDNTLQRVIGSNLAVEDDINNQLADVNDQLQEIFGPTASIEALDIDVTSSSGQLGLDLAGASLTINLRNDRTQLAFTFLTGDGAATSDQILRETVRFTLAGYETTDLWVGTARSEVEIDRTDFEFTVQHRLNETFALIGGVRVEETQLHQTTNSILERSNNMSNLISLLLSGDFELTLAEPETILSEGDAESRLYSLRFGAAAYAPVGEHSVFFASGLLHVSHETGGEGTFTATISTPGVPAIVTVVPGAEEDYIGPDITVGIVRRFGERFDFDARYRASVFFPDSDTDNPRVNHGLSMGFTFWFGN